MSKGYIANNAFMGLLCGIWAGIATPLGLAIWVGFAGCTAFYATGKHHWEGFRLTLATTMVGVLMGLSMAWIGDNVLSFLSSNWATGISIGFVCAVIGWLGAIKLLAFVPGMFVGAYTYFGMNGDWKTQALSLIAGVILGWACDTGGNWIQAKLTPEKAAAPQQDIKQTG